MSDHEFRADRRDEGRSPEERSAFRAFVRDHHPDRGGDPEAFAAGLARFRSADPEAGEPARRDEPLPFPIRVGVALIRTWRRRHDRPDVP